jgi:putative DNA primase/helicase
MTDIRAFASALGGDVVSRSQLTFPGPGHSRRDRSAVLWLVPDAPDGFTVHSHAGDDPLALRDHVRSILGLPGWTPNQEVKTVVQAALPQREREQDDAQRTAKAVRIFEEAEDDHPTLQAYLAARGVELPPGALGDTVRFHPRCPWGNGQTVPAMVSLVREINGAADEPEGPPLAIHRTRLLDDDGNLLLHGKDRKRALGPIGKGVIKLTPDADTTICLGVAEGIETALSLRNEPEFGPSPVWATINAGGLGNFPVLSGIETLWIAVDRDDAGQKAAEMLTGRWAAAGREVFLVEPPEPGMDLNDIDTRGGLS